MNSKSEKPAIFCSELTLSLDVLQLSHQLTLRWRKQKTQLQWKTGSLLKSGAKIFRKIPMANGLAVPRQRLGK